MNARPKVAPALPIVRSAEERIGGYDWQALSTELSSYGCAVIDKLLTPGECREIAALYPHEEHFRSHIHMARHGFGRGEYRYFKYPLPDLLAGLRAAFYPHLASVANAWNECMGLDQRYPRIHADFLKLCRDAGQMRPTPLLLQYVPGDFNCLHQDLYGDLAFPIQVAILLSEPGRITVAAQAATQTDAVSRLQESTYDVLVVDIELAEGNGVAVIRQARQLYPPEVQPLIVVLTNYASDFVRDHCFAAGADYFLDKMRDIALLKAVVVDGRSKWAPPVASH